MNFAVTWMDVGGIKKEKIKYHLLMHIHGIREGNGTPLQYPCLENPMNRGAWWAAVHVVAKSWT